MKITSTVSADTETLTVEQLSPGDLFHDGDFVPLMKTDDDRFPVIVAENGSLLPLELTRRVYRMEGELRIIGKISLMD